jgi:hypothetical protein
LALISRHRHPSRRRLALAPDRHIEASEPDEKVPRDCVYVERVSGTMGTVLAIHRDRRRLVFAWGQLRKSELNPRARIPAKSSTRVPENSAGRLEAARGRHR